MPLKDVGIVFQGRRIIRKNRFSGTRGLRRRGFASFTVDERDSQAPPRNATRGVSIGFSVHGLQGRVVREPQASCRRRSSPRAEGATGHDVRVWMGRTIRGVNPPV